MPPTLNKTHECQIIRKIFSNRENADKAIEAFKDLKISTQDIGIVVRFDDEQIIDRNHRECHDIAQRWLAGWAHLRILQASPYSDAFPAKCPDGYWAKSYYEN